MSHGASWPPLSPRAALLSSPSGRRKYEAYQISQSPEKRSTARPDLIDRLRAARRGDELSLREDPNLEDPEEDEETLRLQLAAIEAKLKLKKMQQIKARAQTPGRNLAGPKSVYESSTTSSAGFSKLQEPTPEPPRVEVLKSPTRQVHPATQPRSPSRVLLGIDKGLRGGDVSLRRANTISSSGRQKDASSFGGGRASSRSSEFTSARSGFSIESRKTFSERMTEVRERERGQEQRRETTHRKRAKGFGVDEAEIEKYRLMSREIPISGPLRSPARLHHEKGYSRDEVLRATEDGNPGMRHLKKSRTMPNLRESPSRPSSRGTDNLDAPHPDASLFEGFSGLHLTSRILPHSFLKRTLPSDQFTVYRIPDLLKQVTSPTYELPDSVCDYVVFGVIASKSSPMDQKKTAAESTTVGANDWERQWEDGSQNQRRFMAFTLTDLKWTIEVYLFGTAVPRYHRLTPGTVVAILNPGLMPPKAGKTDTGAFSLNLNNGEDTVLEIGSARDLGYCKTVKKDGKECGSWLNAAKTDICEWHLNAQLNKTRSQRMGVNTGTNGFGGTGSGGRRTFFDKGSSGKGERNGLLGRDGHRYDRSSGSHFFVATSNAGPTSDSKYRAGFLNNQPSIPEGNLSRDRDARVRKHLAAQEKEREIAEKLGGGLENGLGFGGAGAEYLRTRHSKTGGKDVAGGKGTAANGSATGAGSTIGSERSASILSGPPTNALEDSKLNGNGRKRRAADVRLSPVKKTRFVTEKGIREAGRESVGVAAARRNADESEDDLEIV